MQGSLIERRGKPARLDRVPASVVNASIVMDPTWLDTVLTKSPLSVIGAGWRVTWLLDVVEVAIRETSKGGLFHSQSPLLRCSGQGASSGRGSHWG